MPCPAPKTLVLVTMSPHASLIHFSIWGSIYFIVISRHLKMLEYELIVIMLILLNECLGVLLNFQILFSYFYFYIYSSAAFVITLIHCKNPKWIHIVDYDLQKCPSIYLIKLFPFLNILWLHVTLSFIRNINTITWSYYWLPLLTGCAILLVFYS